MTTGLASGMMKTSRVLLVWLDIAGGLLVTLPLERDLAHPKLGPYPGQYLRSVKRYTTEALCRMLQLVENLTLGPETAAYLTESMHG